MAFLHSLSLSKTSLLPQDTDKVDNLLVDLSHIHRLHCLEIHARNNLTTVIENMHVPWRVIADPPDKDVPTTTDSSH
jgi:hypothetical protein